MNALVGILLSLIQPASSGIKDATNVQCKRPAIRLMMATDSASNGGRPTRIELVFVTDPALLPIFGKMDARDYFAGRESLILGFRRGWSFMAWEVQAGQTIPGTARRGPCGTISTFLFASYRGKGAHRLSFPHDVRGILSLGATDMQWTASR